MVELLPSICKALSLNPSTAKGKKEKWAEEQFVEKYK
jgi:predicted nucleic acid binding AN1-type Zn finger protein